MKIKIDYKPSPRQLEATNAPFRFKCYGGAMGGGKSYWLCQEGLRLSLQYPGNKGYMFRETLKDFKNSTLETLLAVIPSKVIADINKSECFLTLLNGSKIHWAGFAEQRKDMKEKKGSMEVGWFAIDEAHEVSKDDFLYMQSRLRWKCRSGVRPPYYGLLATNPAECWIKYDFVEEKTRKDGYCFIRALPSDNPELPEDYVEQLRNTYSENWIKRYLEGDWEVFTEGIVIPRNLVEDAVNKEIPITGDVTIGCDVAVSEGENADETAIYVIHGYKVVEFFTYTGKDTNITASHCARMYHKHKAKRLMIDDVGVGRGVSDFCENMGLNVYRMVGGSEPSDKTKYRNFKTEIWWNARTLFEEGKVSIPDDEVLKRQLSAIKYDINDKQISIEQKKESKARLGFSPDRADAFIAALWGAQDTAEVQNDYYRQVNRIHDENFPLTRPVGAYGFGKAQQTGFGALDGYY